MELFKKCIHKIKAVDARGKKRPGTVVASFPPSFHQPKCQVKLLPPLPMSLHVPTMSVLSTGPYSPHMPAKGLRSLCPR